MDYLEFDLDSAVATQTAIQGYESTDTPLFSMGRQIQNVVGFKIIETVIPASYYLVSDDVDPDRGATYTRNRIDVTGDSAVFPLGFPDFNLTADRAYTATQLASEFQTQFQAGGYMAEMTAPVTQTCTYDENTAKFTITFTSSAPVDVTPTYLGLTMDISIARMMGLAASSNTSTGAISILATSGTSTTTWSWVSPYIALTSGPNYINVNSRYFSSLVKNYLPQGPLGAVGESNTQICQVPMYVDFGGISYWQDVQQDSFNLQNLFQINNFDLYLTLGTSTTPLVLNGVPWQCKIRVFIDTNTVGTSSAGNVDQLRVVRTIRQT